MYIRCHSWFSSSGKSNAMETVKQAFSDVEDFLGILPDDSQVAIAPTVEALLDLLAKIKHAIGK